MDREGVRMALGVVTAGAESPGVGAAGVGVEADSPFVGGRVGLVWGEPQPIRVRRLRIPPHWAAGRVRDRRDMENLEEKDLMTLARKNGPDNKTGASGSWLASEAFVLESNHFCHRKSPLDQEKRNLPILKLQPSFWQSRIVEWGQTTQSCGSGPSNVARICVWAAAQRTLTERRATI